MLTRSVSRITFHDSVHELPARLAVDVVLTVVDGDVNQMVELSLILPPDNQASVADLKARALAKALEVLRAVVRDGERSSEQRTT